MKTNPIFPIVAIIPSLNPDKSLIQVVNDIKSVGFTNIILVNDGSRAECLPMFEACAQIQGCIILHHQRNQGKGRALKTAFRYYLEQFDQTQYKGVVTADADGQHTANDILKTADNLCLLAEKNKKVLSLGTRNFNAENVPPKSRSGNKITTVVFSLLYGKKINDTQTGLRGISNNFVKMCLEIKGERFEYEINMLIQGVLQSVVFSEVPIETVYFDNNRETHFRPFIDSVKIYRVMFASFFKFAFSGLGATLLDQGLFIVLQKIIFAMWSITFSIPVSTLLARIGSSFFNYLINKKVVFGTKGKSYRSLLRYYLLCLLQLCASAILVTGLHTFTNIEPFILKILVDTVLFFISYRIQRSWVFKEESHNDN